MYFSIFIFSCSLPIDDHYELFKNENEFFEFLKKRMFYMICIIGSFKFLTFILRYNIIYIILRDLPFQLHSLYEM